MASKSHGPVIIFFLYQCILIPVQAIHRTVGAPSDHDVQRVASRCGGQDLSSFEAGRCPLVLNCVLDNLDSATTWLPSSSFLPAQAAPAKFEREDRA